MKNKKVLKIILNVFIWIFVAFSAFMTVLSLAASTSPDGIPSLAGTAFMTVASDSMEDTIMTGDLITAKKLSDEQKKQLEVGDVITFYKDLDGDGNEEINTHRIIEIVYEADGTTVAVTIGEDAGDPVFCISDLLPHLGKDQRERKMNDVLLGEEMNVIVGSLPFVDEDGEDVKEAVKLATLVYLNEKYGITEKDFLRAEVEVVPAGKARDVGFDRSMVGGYGHDDRVCAYTSIVAEFETKNPTKTTVTIFADKEEIGSVGATGMESKFFENCVAEVMNLAGCYSELAVRRAMKNSKVLSSDVSAAYDPNFPSVMEKKKDIFIKIMHLIICQ